MRVTDADGLRTFQAATENFEAWRFFHTAVARARVALPDYSPHLPRAFRLERWAARVRVDALGRMLNANPLM